LKTTLSNELELELLMANSYFIPRICATFLDEKLSGLRGDCQVPQSSEYRVLKFVVVGRILVLAQKSDHFVRHGARLAHLFK